MAMRNLFLKLRTRTDSVIVFIAYISLFVASATAYTIIRDKRLAAEEYCENHRGILFTDRTGDYICIKEKSIVK